MSTINNPKQHPDANLLGAFAENSLLPAEREHILAHLAECGDCREVVFLAQLAEQVMEVPAVAAAASRAPTPRFRWSFATLSVAAVACAVLVAVSVGIYRHSSKPAMPFIAQTNPSTQAKVEAPAPLADSTQTQEAALAAQTPLAGKAGKRVPGPRSSSPPVAAPATASTVGEPPPARGIGKPADKAPAPAESNGSLGQVSESVAVQADSAQLETKSSAVNQQLAIQSLRQQRAGAALGGMAAAPSRQAAPTKSSPVGGPIFLQQKASTPSIQAVDRNLWSSSPEFRVANGFVERSQSGTWTILDFPSSALVVVGGPAQLLALDTNGKLFASGDGGARWSAIPVQWTGKAVSLKTAPTVPPKKEADAQIHGSVQSSMGSLATDEVAPATAEVSQQTPATMNAGTSYPVASVVRSFELTNDHGEKWVSKDGGKTWHRAE